MKSNSSIFQNLKLRTDQLASAFNYNNNHDPNEKESKTKSECNNKQSASKLSSMSATNLKDKCYSASSMNSEELNSNLIERTRVAPSSSYLPIHMPNQLGPIYLVGYLGSAILTKGKTGLGCLQQPLRELYILFRQHGSRLIQERRLVISMDGLTMLYNELGSEKFLHNDLSSVNDVQLLKLVCEQRKDKKSYCAFLPMGEELEISYNNIFHPLDKTHIQLLENVPHPPLIALIMRRSVGIQALECHVCIARTLVEAREIVFKINEICTKHKSEMNQKTKVFQYSPYLERNKDRIVLNSHSSATQNKTGQASQVDAKKNALLPPRSPFIPNRQHHQQQQQKSKQLQFENNLHENAGTAESFYDNNNKFIIKSSNKIDKRESQEIKTQTSEINSESNSVTSPSKSNGSIFNKIKSNFIDKSSSKDKENSNAKIAHESGKNDCNKQEINTSKPNAMSLSSHSAIGFFSSPEKSILKKTPNNDDSKKSKKSLTVRPSSALGKLLHSTHGDSVSSSSEKKQTCREEAKIDIKKKLSSASEKEFKTPSTPTTPSKREKKLSFGKRLLQSARSSLKSNSNTSSSPSSTTSKSSSTQLNSSKHFLSASTTSLNKQTDIDFNKLADIDFRKSRVSILDDNLLIDSSVNFSMNQKNNQPRRPQSSIDIPIDVVKQRSQTPNSYRMIGANGVTPLPLDSNLNPNLNIHSNKSTNFILKGRVEAMRDFKGSLNSNPIYGSSPAPAIRINQRTSSAAAPILRNSNPISNLNNNINKAEYVYKKRSGSTRNEHESQLLHQYLNSDSYKANAKDNSKLFANHLVWNNVSKSAECLDDSEPHANQNVKAVINNINNRQVNNLNSSSSCRIVNASKIARAISPGFSLNSNKLNSILVTDQHILQAKHHQQQQQQQQKQMQNSFENQTARITSSSDNTSSFFKRSNDFNSNVKQQASLFNSNALKDSAYNTNSSTDDGEIERCNLFSYKAQNRAQQFEEANELTQVSKASSIAESSIRTQSEHKFEQDEQVEREERKSKNHKLVGGVKVFPSLPHQHRQAAEIRRNRLNAIEANLSELENKLRSSHSKLSKELQSKLMSIESVQHKQHEQYELHQQKHNASMATDEISDNDNEVIDLTRTTTVAPSSGFCGEAAPRSYKYNDELHGSHIYEDDNMLNEISLNLKATRSIPIQIIASHTPNRVKFEIDNEENERIKSEEISSEMAATSDFKQKFQFIKHPRQQLNNFQSFQSFNDPIVSSMNSDKIIKSVETSSPIDPHLPKNNNQAESQQTNFIYYLDQNQHFCGY